MELLILLFLFLLNGVFAMSEMAVVSSRKVRLQQWADDGRAGAKTALALANNPSYFLSTIQVGITVIGVTSGAFGEAALSEDLSRWLAQWPIFAQYSNELAVAIVVIGITIGSLIIGELVPKRLALLNPEAIASIIAQPMHMLSTLAYPVVRALSLVTESILKLLGQRASTEPSVTEDEIQVLMEQGAEAGIFEEHEQALVKRVFRIDEMRVTGVMTPRSDIVYVDLDADLQTNIRRISESHHSRFPVVRGGPEHVVGFAQVKRFIADAVAGRPLDFAAKLVKPLFVPQSLTVMEVVESFKKHRQTMALVINEYGEVQGLVTLNDVMEALVGDIATLDGDEDRDVVEREDGSWLVEGGVTIERFKDIADIDGELPEEDSGEYHTLGGFAMMQLGHVPLAGDKFRWNDFDFEIVDMDRNRVDKLIVTRVFPAADPQGES